MGRWLGREAPRCHAVLPARPLLTLRVLFGGVGEAEEGEGVAVEDLVGEVFGEWGEAGLGHALGHGDDVVEAVDGFLDGGDGEVGAEEEFVGDAVFDGEAEGVVELPGAVEEAGDVGIYVGLFTNEDDGFGFPGMAEVGDDHFEGGERRAMSSSCSGWAYLSGALRGKVVPWWKRMGRPSFSRGRRGGWRGGPWGASRRRWGSF